MKPETPQNYEEKNKKMKYKFGPNDFWQVKKEGMVYLKKAKELNEILNNPGLSKALKDI